MNDRLERSSALRVSLRELLLLLGFIALACAALKYANDWWETAISAVALLLLMVSVVVALVDRGRRQAVAIGFAAFMGLYGLMGWIRQGDLPTGMPLSFVYRWVVNETWIDLTTGQVVPNYAPTAASNFGAAVGLSQTPDRGTYMEIGHLLWGLLLGYVGSRLAAWVFSRREAMQPNRPDASTVDEANGR
jgi:hypothetical protein